MGQWLTPLEFLVWATEVLPDYATLYTTGERLTGLVIDR